MKKPSGFMPKYKEKPAGILGWLFLFIFLGIVLWFLWSIPYLMLLVPIFFVLSFFEKRKRERHFINLLRDRDNDSICTFSRHFEFRAIDI